MANVWPRIVSVYYLSGLALSVSSCGVKLQKVVSGLEKKAKTLDIHMHYCGFSQHSFISLIFFSFHLGCNNFFSFHLGCNYTFLVLTSVTARPKSVQVMMHESKGQHIGKAPSLIFFTLQLDSAWESS